MKALKYIITSLVLSCGVVMFAQNTDAPKQGKGSSRGAPNWAAGWIKDITLTADQQKKVDEIVAEANKKVADTPTEERRSKTRAFRTEARNSIRELLTDEQKTKFDENLKAAADAAAAKKKKGDDAKKGGKKPKNKTNN